MRKNTSIVLVLSLLIFGSANSFFGESWSFFIAFFRSAKHVGSIFPSSSFAAKAITKYITKKNDPIRILEVGAGTGVFTEEITKKIRKKDRLDVIEIDSELCKVLKEKFEKHKNVKIYCESVLDWEPNGSYDFVVSAIPMKSFEPKFVFSLLDKYKKIIAENGVLSYIEYSWLTSLKSFFIKGEEKKSLEKNIEILDNLQKECGIDKSMVWLNLPPANIYHVKLKKEKLKLKRERLKKEKLK